MHTLVLSFIEMLSFFFSLYFGFFFLREMLCLQRFTTFSQQIINGRLLRVVIGGKKVILVVDLNLNQ